MARRCFHDFVSPDDIPEGCNLGVLCGTPVERDNRTYWVADNDIDQPAAAPVFVRTYEAFGIPKPLSWGREGKPNSHALFLIDEPMNTAGAAHEYHRIAEFRCQSKDGEYAPYGHQSVIFPSVWCKDEKVEVIRREPDSAAEPPMYRQSSCLKPTERRSRCACLSRCSQITRTDTTLAMRSIVWRPVAECQWKTRFASLHW